MRKLNLLSNATLTLVLSLRLGLSTPPPAKLINKADLRQASKALDNTVGQNGSDSNPLDSAVNSLL